MTPAVQASGGSPGERAELARALLDQGRLAEAAEILQDCIRLQPRNPEYHAALGQALLALGRDTEAEKELHQAVLGEPADHASQARLGQVLAKRADFDGAEKHFREAARLDPQDPSYQAGHGRALAKRGKTADAEASLRRAIWLDPGNPGYQDALGTVLAGHGKHAAAELAYQQAVELDPRVAAYWGHLGQALTGQARYQDAQSAFQEAIRLDPQASDEGAAAYWDGLAGALAAQGQHPAAEAAFRQGIELDQLSLDPGAADRRSGLGRALTAQGRHTEAEAEFREAVRIDQDDAAHHADLAQALAAQNRYTAAESEFRLAVQLAPGQAAYHSGFGRLMLSRQYLVEAEPALRRAAELSPGNPAYLADLAEALLRRGKLADAERLFRTAAHLDPANPAYRAGHARALSAVGHYDEAQASVADFQAATAADAPGSAEELARSEARHGSELAAQGRHQEAQRLFRLAMRREPANAAFLSLMGASLLAEGQHSDAYRCFSAAIELDVTNASYHAYAGRVRFAQDRFSEAEHYARQAVQLEPENAVYHADLGRILAAQHRLEDASGALRRAIQLDPGSAAYQADLGRAYAKQQDHTEAEAAFREAVWLDPSNPAYQGELGRTLSSQERATEAESALREAVRLDPSNPAYQAELGHVLLKQHRSDEAEAVFREAARQAPGIPSYCAGLGLVLLSQGQLTQAEDVLDRILETHPPVDDAEVNQLRSAVNKAYDQEIVKYVQDEAGKASSLPSWPRRGISRLAYDRQVTDITQAKLPDIRSAYRAWSDARRREETSRRKRHSWARGLPQVVGDMFLITLALAAAALLHRGVIRVDTLEERHIAEAACLTAGVLCASLLVHLATTAWRAKHMVKPLVVLEEQLRSLIADLVIDPSIAALATSYQDSAVDQVTVGGLNPKAEGNHLISTAAEGEIVELLRHPSGASLAIAGPRGSGKSELVRTFTELQSPSYSDRTIRFRLSVPAKCNGPVFILQLLNELCGIVALIETSNINGGEWRSHWRRKRVLISQRTKGRAAKLRVRIEFTETYTRGSQLRTSSHGLGLLTTKGSQRTRIRFSGIEVAREFEGLVHSLAEDGWRLIVGIDELDKIQKAPDAIAFLSDVKDLFPIPSCSFIVSVSEDLQARFSSRGIRDRDIMDSSFFKVVRVRMLRPPESRDLLQRRSDSITDTQALLCHCLSGGLPRDLLRAAQNLADVARKMRAGDEAEPPFLCDVLTVLLGEDLESRQWASRFRPRDGKRRDRAGTAASWSSLWPDPAKTEQMLRTSCQVRTVGRPADLLEEPELAAYVGVLHTVRQAFSPGGPMSTLAQASASEQQIIEQGFGLIAEAKEFLAEDVERTWKLLHAARAVLHLPTLDGSTATSPTSLGMHIATRQAPDDAELAAPQDDEG